MKYIILFTSALLLSACTEKSINGEWKSEKSYGGNHVLIQITESEIIAKSPSEGKRIKVNKVSQNKITGVADPKENHIVEAELQPDDTLIFTEKRGTNQGSAKFVRNTNAS